MTNAEVTAYNYGRRLAEAATEAVKAGHGQDMQSAAFTTPEETEALERLGVTIWLDWVRKGGESVMGAGEATP
jgi:hypothetical protein